MSKKQEIKAAGKSACVSIDQFIEKDYHTRVPVFPETVDDQKTNDFIAWKMGRVPVKARVFSEIRFLIIDVTHNQQQ